MKAALRIPVRVSLIAGGTLVVLFVGAVGVFLYPAPGMCGIEIIAEYHSPQAARRVVVFQRDCGATTGFSTQASILAANEVLENEAGNLFTADTDHGAAPVGPAGGPLLSVAWLDDESVLLVFHPRARVFKNESEVAGVRVHYENSAQHRAPVNAEPAKQPRRD